MRLGRRTFLRGGAGALGLAAIGCTAPKKESVLTDLRVRRLETLPVTELDWLRLNDHFVATVGPAAGTGEPLGPLLVLADATFAPRSRFPLHPHREMEILSLVLDGELSHHGTQAHGATMRAREAQLISSRSGIVHAEGNETDAPTRMLQIWFQPNARGGAPAYFRRDLPALEGGGRQLVAGDDVMPLRSDARVWWLDLAPGADQPLEVAPGRAGYLLALDSELFVGSDRITNGEGATLRHGATSVRAAKGGSALWIEVAV